MNPASASAVVRVGVVGPEAAVGAIIEVAETMASVDVAGISIVGTAYTRPAQIAPKVRAISPDVDAVLFAGPLPHDVAIAAGALSVPATHVELSGSALYGALVRALRQGVDVERVSIDSLSKPAVAEAYGDCNLDRRQVRSAPYSGPDSAAGFVEFHAALHASGKTVAALTTVDRVARELSRLDVPVVRIKATNSALRTSLRSAALLGAGTRLQSSAVVVGLVELPDVTNTATDARRSWAVQELRLEAWRALRPETDAAAISVLPRDDHSLVLMATLASLGTATSDFTRAPFSSAIQDATGIEPAIGFGMGTNAIEAERQADLALTAARAAKSGQRTKVRTLDGSLVTLDRGEPGPPQLVSSKHLDTLKELKRGVGRSEGAVAVIDSESAAEVLGVSPRTARRLLQDLARVGLAWPVPPAGGGATPGRPRQTYRLVEPAG
jgi:hypothetical protein